MKSINISKKLMFVFLTLFIFQGLTGQSLKSLAEAQGKYIGNLMRDSFFDGVSDLNDEKQGEILTEEYNALVTGNQMKMTNLIPNKPQDPFNIKIEDIETGIIDKFVNYADERNMRKRGHVMIWFKGIPQWLKTESALWTAQQVYDFSTSYVRALTNYTKESIDEWDLLNEALSNDGYRTNTWYDIVDKQQNDEGKIGYLEYFGALFKAAKQEDPNGAFFYNDFGTEFFNTSKRRVLFSMLEGLNNINARVDGVGFQSHFSLDFISRTNTINSIEQTIQELDKLGYEVGVTELDIRICDEEPASQSSLETQRIAFKNFVSMVMQQDNCRSVMLWGITDHNSWIPFNNPNCNYATPHNSNYEKKPAYFGIQEGLKEALALKQATLNKIKKVDAPKKLYSKSEVKVTVTYETTQPADIVFLLQTKSLPKTQFLTVEKSVTTGLGVVNFDIFIEDDIPYSTESYELVTLLVPSGQDWSTKTDEFVIDKVSVLESEPPTPVTQLEASNIARSGFDLTWNPANDNIGVTEYDVYVDDVLVGSSSNTAYTVSQLTTLKTYKIAVITKDAAGNSSIPTTINVANTLGYIIAVNGPTEVEISSTITVPITYNSFTESEMVVSFKQSKAPSTVYKLVRTPLQIGENTVDVIIDIPQGVPLADSAYEYTTYIVPVGGEWGNRFDNKTQKNVSVKVIPPSIPSNFVVTNLTEKSFDLSWDASTSAYGISEYEVDFRDNLTTVSTNLFTANNLTPKTEYEVKVRAKDTRGIFSEFATYTVKTNALGTIVSINGPTAIAPNTTILVPVTYKAVLDGEIVVSLKRDNPPRTIYKQVRIPVNSGEETIDISIDVPGDIPISEKDYEYQVYIVPVGGDWNSRYDNTSQKDITVKELSSLSLDDIQNTDNSESDIVVYPNPVKSSLLLKNISNVQKINIINVIGKRISTHTDITNEKRIDMESYTNGIYMIRFFINNGNIVTKKIIKQ